MNKVILSLADTDREALSHICYEVQSRLGSDAVVVLQSPPADQNFDFVEVVGFASIIGVAISAFALYVQLRGREAASPLADAELERMNELAGKIIELSDAEWCLDVELGPARTYRLRAFRGRTILITGAGIDDLADC